MESIFLKRIRFGSYIKLIMTISVAMGIVFGLFTFLIGILGGPVTVNMGKAQYTGQIAGILGLFIGPFVFCLLGFMISLLTFLPFIGFMKILKKMKLHGEFEVFSDEIKYEE